MFAEQQLYIIELINQTIGLVRVTPVEASTSKSGMMEPTQTGDYIKAFQDAKMNATNMMSVLASKSFILYFQLVAIGNDSL